jgi:glycosyltransferase involved in cell wall biosynthesis
MPRVAHLINTVGLGGVPEAVYQLMRVMEKRDLTLYVLRRTSFELLGSQARLDRFIDLGIPIRIADGYEAKHELVDILRGWMIEDSIDILHTHSYKPNLHGRMAAIPLRAHGLKIVAHYHNSYDDKWSEPGAIATERRLAGESDRIIACSSSVRSHIAGQIGISEAQIAMVQNGVDLGRFATERNQRDARIALGLPLDVPVVGVVGRISAQKGQDDFLSAARHVHERHPTAHFALVGGSDSAALEQRIRQQVIDDQLSDVVHMIGFVDDMPQVYAALDILAVPSRWEGFGLVLVEAMASGRPIVATAVGAIPEVVTDTRNALLTPPGDTRALADAITRLIESPQQRERLASNGRVDAAQFSWERSGKQLEELYTELCGVAQ